MTRTGSAGIPRESRGGENRALAGARLTSALIGCVGLVVSALVALAPPARAVGRIDRPGVYALGLAGSYGLIEGNSRYGLDFNRGGGYNLHFRYNTSRKVAFTLYFDNQTFDARADSLVNVRFTAVHGGIRLFSIPSGDVLRYFEITAGFYRPEIRFPKTIQSSIGEEVCFPAEGFLAHAGTGIELFFTSSWAVEFGAHGYLLMGKGLCPTEDPAGEKDLSVTGQAAIGLSYYLLR